MMRYMVFMRGINVSGQKLIKMNDLTKIFTGSGYKNVKTFIQSGNVVFDASESDCDALVLKISSMLDNSLGYHVDVMLRTYDEINQMVVADPFGSIEQGRDVKKYITFVNEPLKDQFKLPHMSPTGDVEVFKTEGSNIFSIALPAKDGRYGFPNIFIEKLLKVPATTRNWNTVCKMVAEN